MSNIDKIATQENDDANTPVKYRYIASRRMADVLIEDGYDVQYTFFKGHKWVMGVTVRGVCHSFTSAVADHYIELCELFDELAY